MLQAGVDGLAEETFPVTANDQSPGILTARLDRIPVWWVVSARRRGVGCSKTFRHSLPVRPRQAGRPGKIYGAGGHNTRRLKADAS